MKRSIVGLMVLALAVAGVVQAQPGAWGPHPEGNMQRNHGDLMETLNLTPDQEKKFNDYRADLERSMVKTRSAVRLAQIDLEQLMQGDTPDKNAIGKKMKEISDLEYQQKLAGLDHMFAVRDMLTPEQRELWKEHHRGEGPGWKAGERGRCQCPMHDGPRFGGPPGFRGDLDE